MVQGENECGAMRDEKSNAMSSCGRAATVCSRIRVTCESLFCSRLQLHILSPSFVMSIVMLCQTGTRGLPVKFSMRMSVRSESKIGTTIRLYSFPELRGKLRMGISDIVWREIP